MFNDDNNGEGGAPWIWEIIASDSDQQMPGTFIMDIDGAALELSRSVPSRSSISCTVKLVTGCYKLDPKTYLYPVELGWHNCYSFGNGLESDRIRDDFNAPTIDNGVKVSTTLDTYGEERRGSGMIWSGIYNSTSGVNELNEFNMAESITKDLNPSYGTLQALKTRDTNVVAFCEDKVFKILANKDSLYNADGSSNVTASNAVLGDAKAFVGDYGISSNPESLAVTPYAVYFTDAMRGAVLRLTNEGLVAVSDKGMKDYFADNLKSAVAIVGAFNDRKSEYDITIHSGIDTTNSTKNVSTIPFNEDTNGWVSFRGYALEQGLSLNNTYYTFKGGELYEHGVDPGSAARNNFYGIQYYSSVTPVSVSYTHLTLPTSDLV